jgi:hypothetical protein
VHQLGLWHRIASCAPVDSPPGGWHGLAKLGRGPRILRSSDPPLPKPHLATRPVEPALGLRTRARPWETPGRGCLHGGADKLRSERTATAKRQSVTPRSPGTTRPPTAAAPRSPSSLRRFVAPSLRRFPAPALLKPLSAAPVRIFDKSAAAAPANGPPRTHRTLRPPGSRPTPHGRHARPAQSSIPNPLPPTPDSPETCRRPSSAPPARYRCPAARGRR